MDREGRLQGLRGTIEHGEELVRSSVDLAPARPTHGQSDHGAHVGEKGGIAIAQPLEKARRPFDVGEEERHVPGGQGSRFARLGIDLATEPLVLDRQLDRRGHCLHQVRIVEDLTGVHESGHGPAVALEEGHRAAFSIGRQGGRPPCSIEVPAG